MIDNNPLVSIIINCFNGEKYLHEALNSVLNQTYKNWEIIFWDNKSTDSSAKIFNSYNDKRFKYFCSNEHTSLYKARNLAIEKSKGEFISFLDADDLWDKNKLNLQIPYFSNPEVGVVYTNLWILKKNIKKKKIHTKKKLTRGKIYEELIKNYNIGIITTVIRKSYFFKLKKKFDERFMLIGDFDLFLRLAKICIFESIQIPLAFYRLHGKNVSTINKEKEIAEFEIWLSENKDNLSKFHFKSIQKKIDYRKFVNYKIEKNHTQCLKMLLNPKKGLFSVKNAVMFFTPVFMLKKLLWYHQD